MLERRLLRPEIIEPTILPTRLVTGILPPTISGGNMIVSIYDEHITPDGAVEWLIVERLAWSRKNYIRATLEALSPIRADPSIVIELMH